MLIALALRLGTVGQIYTDSWLSPSRVARSALRRLIRSTISLLARFGELVNTLPIALKMNMAPKTIWNSGDKGEGARVVRIGKGKGDTAVAGRRPYSTAVKSSGNPP
ncbi:hypothetical protein NDU88_002984 [Pleurodeles waltl]|uniref:Uncharacterized protein n=1 Tax=Pleurodeles waltl TaxID=8319 RepID=A0AAV7WN29_PLEWA|nr:hypothetical protein NDU88_002984 [Pleurodeles waltl]